MADGYIEKRYAEVFGANGKATAETPRRPSLDSLLVKCKPAATITVGKP